MQVSETRTTIMETQASNARIWLFRLLVVAGAGLMLVSWYLPWWTINIEGFGDNMVQIRPWGLVMAEQLGGFAILLKGAEMPAWFGPMMWAYLGLCLLALLLGMFVRGKDLSFARLKFSLSQLLVGGVGFSYILAGIVAAVYAGIRMKSSFDVPLQGRSHIDLGDPLIAFIDTRLLPGYYLIYLAGIGLLLLSIFRSQITGEK